MASLQIDSTNQATKDLATMISETLPWALSTTDQGNNYLILTATPTYAPEPPTATIEPTQTTISTAPVKQPAGEAHATYSPPKILQTQPTNPVNPPICGSILILPLLLATAWFIFRNH
jgi:hypothetical protein